MIHKSLFTASAFIALGFTASADDRVFPVADFDGIETRHAIDVVYQAGDAYSVSVEQEAGDFSDIRVEVENGQLVLKRVSMSHRLRRQSLSVRNNLHGEKVIKVNGKRVPVYSVRITSPGLTRLKASSSSHVLATGINADRFSVAASSSSDMTLVGQTDNLSIDTSSSATLDASDLIAGTLDIEASSSSDVTATSLNGDLDIDASSSSDVTVANAGGNVHIEASSSTDVDLSGSCNDLYVKASSSADVIIDDLGCLTGDLTASSSADVNANVTGSIRMRASSSGDIVVDGNPEILDVRTSSGGDVEVDGRDISKNSGSRGL